MTLIIILGGFAALYLVVLLFRIAVHAFAVYVGAGATLFLHGQGHGVAASFVVGFGAALVVHLTGRALHGWIRSPLSRLILAVLFAAPAGFAGYQLVAGLAGLLIGDAGWLRVLALAGGVATAAAAWQKLAGMQGVARREAGGEAKAVFPSTP